LRDRASDIPLLADHFLKLACRRHGLAPLALHARHLQRLKAHDWPGNVRELQNIIERAVIDARHGPLEIPLALAPSPHAAKTAALPPSAAECDSYEKLQSLERDLLMHTLHATNWVVSGPKGAARALGVKPTTLKYRMDKLLVRKPTN
jgi:transcriptional regulator with GAF, ATPase, and Fis domain